MHGGCCFIRTWRLQQESTSLLLNKPLQLHNQDLMGKSRKKAEAGILSGKKHENEKGIFDAILEGEIDFESSPWPSISDSAKDLIRKMLNPDPKKRITAAQVPE